MKNLGLNSKILIILTTVAMFSMLVLSLIIIWGVNDNRKVLMSSFSDLVKKREQYIIKVVSELKEKSANLNLAKMQHTFDQDLKEVNNKIASKKERFILFVLFGIIGGLGFFLIASYISTKYIITDFMERLARSLDKLSSVICSKSKETGDAGDTLTSSSKEQISSLEVCIEAVSEMEALVSQTEKNTNSSIEFADKVVKMSKDGDAVMTRLGGAMEHFQTFGAQLKEVVTVINDISTRTNVIDDIVFKTQLLSFNASIEAARAGHHGRGFSVVAEEVGTLAKVSGEAAYDIHHMLEKSKQKVQGLVDITGKNINEGKAVYEDARVIFSNILANVDMVNSHMADVVSAAGEQTIGIKQVSETVTIVDRLAGLNSENAGRAKDISLELISFGGNLKDLFNQVDLFVNGGGYSTDTDIVVNNLPIDSGDYDNVESIISKAEVDSDEPVVSSDLTFSEEVSFDDDIDIDDDTDDFSVNIEFEDKLIPGQKESDKLSEIINDLKKKSHSGEHY